MTKQRHKISVKAKIDKTQQNSRCRLCDDRDETINHIISDCSKSAQREYKTRHDWVGKAVYWELCKKFKFDLTNKWYIHNPESVLENKTQKILWDFEKQADNLISARRPAQETVNKKENLPNCGPYRPADHWVKLKESGKRELKKKLWNIKITVIPIVNGGLGTVISGLV